MDLAPVLTVVDRRGKEHQVIGWAAILIGKVLACQDQINNATAGQLVCDFGPKSGVKLHWSFLEIGRE